MQGDIEVLIAGGDAERRRDEADALAAADEDLRVRPAESGATDAGDADCVVRLGAAADPVGDRPTVAFTEAPPSAVPDDVAYVRRGEGAHRHLADRVRRLVGSVTPASRAESGPSTAAASGGGSGVSPSTVVEAMRDGAIVVDADYRIRFVNRAVASVLDLDREALADRSVAALSEIGLVSGETVERLEATVDELAGGERETRTLALTLTPRSHEDLDVELRVTPLPDDAACDGVLATVRDITARRTMEARIRESHEKIERLHDIASEMVACDDPREVYELTVTAASRVLDFEVCLLDVVEDGEFVPVATSEGIDDHEYEPKPVGDGLVGRTYRSGESILVDDVRETDAAEPADDRYRSVLSVPVGDHGVFQAGADVVGAFDARDRDLAELLLAHAAETLDRLGAEKRLRERRNTIERLHESTAEIVAAADETELCELTVEAAESVLDFDVCAVMLATDDGEELVMEAVSDGEPAPDPGSRLPANRGVAGETFETGESVLVEDAQHEDTAAPHDDSYRSALSIPIGDAGVVQGISADVAAYDRDDLELAELLATHVGETLQRIRAEGELTAERDRFRALFENVPDPVVSYEFEGGRPIVRDVNGPFEEVFGFEAAEVVGEDVDEYIVPGDRADEAASLNERLQAGENLQTTSKRRTADGELRDFLLHVVPLAVGERSLQGYSIYTDITEQKRRERELERQNERLDEFASIVSHDLRNPLNVARGNFELAREHGDEDLFDRVEAAHDRMHRMIHELLTLARQGDVVGETGRVSLRTVAHDAWSTVETGAASLRVADDGTVVADEDRLAELLGNLYRNAIEHGPSEVTVTVGPTDRGFYVEDDGPGIPESERELIFDSGYTTAEEGTGFGLSIVERIAEAHDWSVSVENGAEGGARFVFHTRTAGEADSSEVRNV